MALRYLDSFDTYTTVLQRYTAGGGAIGAAALRTGIAGIRFAVTPTTNRLTLTAQGTWIIGTGFRRNGFDLNEDILRTIDTATVQGVVRSDATGVFTLKRGATVVATGVTPILANTYYYLEFKHIILNAAGTLELRVNGAVTVTFSGDTQETANATADQFAIGPQSGASSNIFDYDDLYVLDGTGAAPNNDYWGTTQVEAIVPSGAGNYTAWGTLVGAATHWQAVNEIPPNEDTSYVEATAIDQRDTYAFGNLTPTSATINGIQVSMRARTTLAGALNIARMYRSSGGVDSQGADIVLSTSYVSILEQIALNPDGGAAWTVAAVNGAEFGARSR